MHDIPQQRRHAEAEQTLLAQVEQLELAVDDLALARREYLQAVAALDETRTDDTQPTQALRALTRSTDTEQLVTVCADYAARVRRTLHRDQLRTAS